MATAEKDKILNVPNLRFPEFTGEWERIKISDFGEIVTGNTPPKADADNYQEEGYLWASPTDLGEVKYICNTQTKLSKKGFAKTRQLPEGSILVTCIGSIGKMGMAKQLMSSNQQINSVIVKDDIDNDFVYYAIQSQFSRYLASVAVQVVPIINKSTFSSLANSLPSPQEQAKIGRLFSVIDARIATQNKIIEKLQSLIKGLAEHLTKSGQPNVKLSDCLACHSSSLQESSLSENGAYPVYGANGIVGYDNGYQVNGSSILIIKDGAGIGGVTYVEGKYSVIATLNYLTAKSDFNLLYLYYSLLIFDFKPYKTGMAIPHIYFKDYSRAKIFCPPKEQQSRIASLLFCIEKKLAIEKKIVTYFVKFKGYLLQQMFI